MNRDALSGEHALEPARRARGRPLGSKNKSKRHTFDAALRSRQCDVEKLIVDYAMNRVSCEDCEDGRVPRARYMLMSGVTEYERIMEAHDEYQYADEDERASLLMPCPSCAGRARVPLDPRECLKAAIHVSRTRTPQLSSVAIEKEQDMGVVWKSLNHDADGAEARVLRKLKAYWEGVQEHHLGAEEHAEQEGRASDDTDPGED